MPNALVFAVLAGIAWWGHQSGWTLPKISAMKGDATKLTADWCEEHTVPESICVECDEKLLPRSKSFGWCRDHGVHECPLCHPDLAQLSSPYCVSDSDRERAKRALATERSENSKNCKLHRRRLQFASLDAYKKSGVDIDLVSRAAIRETIPVYGEITFDPGRIAHLASRSPGSVVRVCKHLGDHVENGETLALVDAADVGKAKTEFLQSARLLDARTKNFKFLESSGAIPPVSIRQAELALSEARIRFISARQSLINLGLPRTFDDLKLLSDAIVNDVNETDLARRIQFLGIPEDIRGNLADGIYSSNLMPLRASMRGVIVSRDVVAGEVVDVNRTLFEIVDTSRVWLILEVRAEDIEKIAINKSKVLFKVDGQRREFEGTISFISTEADSKTRTVKVRAELVNDDGKLRANTFGSGRIILRDEPEAIVVPSSAVHWEGDCHIVFVRDKNWLNDDSYKVFYTRVVRIAMRDEEKTEIIAGVLPGEVVATKGSEVLRAELLRANFGEG